MGLRDRYGILATAFDSRFISNRFKLERNIRLGCGAVPHQGGLNLSAILFIEHNRLFMPFQLRVHRHYDHFSRFISYDEITVRRDFNDDCIRKILHMAVYQRILIPFRHTLVEKLSHPRLISCIFLICRTGQKLLNDIHQSHNNLLV